MPETVTMGKLQRKAHLFYIDATFGGETPSWFLVGKDVEDMSIELNPDTETIKNILDENTVKDNGYQPSISVDTYYANPSDGDFYTHLKNIAMNRLTGEACRTKVLEVLVDKTTGPFDAWQEYAVIKPQSYGGAQGGVSIPYNVNFDGGRVQGTIAVTDKVPGTFTESSTANT